MKLYASIALFAVLVFGIGWTSHLLVAQMDAAEAGGREEGPCRGNSCDRYGSQGPYLSTVERLANDLELTDDQLVRLQDLIARTIVAVERHEGAICDVMADSRDQVHAILTGSQRERLAQVLNDRWRLYRERRVKAAVDWGEQNRMPDTTLALIQSVVARYETQKEGYFRHLHEQQEWPTPQEKQAALSGFKQECNLRLAEVLEEPQLEALWEELATCHEDSGTDRDDDVKP